MPTLPAVPAPLAAWFTRHDAWLPPLALVLLVPALWWLLTRLAVHVNAVLARLAGRRPGAIDPLLLRYPESLPRLRLSTEPGRAAAGGAIGATAGGAPGADRRPWTEA